MIKLSTVCASVVSLCAMSSLGHVRVAHAENELRIATLAPDGSDWMKVFDKGAAEVKEKTSGRVTLKYFAGGQQGDERDYVRKIKLGQLDGAGVTSIGLSMIDESIRVLELPRMFDDVKEVDYVANKMWPYFQAKFARKGFRLEDRGEVGWIYVISKSPIKSAADLRKAKIWQWGDDVIMHELYKQMNVHGTPLGVPEVEPSLTSGRLNAAYTSPYAAVALQWFTKVKYITTTPISFSIGATVVSDKAVKKLSAADQKTVLSISHSSSKKLRRVIRKANKNAIRTMKKRGVQEIDSTQLGKDLDAAAQNVWKALVGKVYSQQELDLVLKYRAEYRKKHKK